MDSDGKLRRNTPEGPVRQPSIDVFQDLNNNLTYKGNLGVEVVATTRDKISNALHVALPKYEMRNSWIAPAGLALTLVLTIFTADFRDVLVFSGDMVFGACLLGTVIAVFATFRNLYRKKKSFRHADVVDSIVHTHEETNSRIIRGS